MLSTFLKRTFFKISKRRVFLHPDATPIKFGKALTLSKIR